MEKPFGLHDLYKMNSALEGLGAILRLGQTSLLRSMIVSILSREKW